MRTHMARSGDRPRSSMLRTCALVIAGAAALIAGGCRREEPVALAPVARPVKILTVGAESSLDVREYPGRVSAVREAAVAFEVGGRIVELPVIEGQRGTLLAKLDARDFEAKLTAAKADRDAAEADYMRFKELLDKDAVSRRDFETRQRNFEVAKSRIDIAEKALEDTVLRAPFSGRVARKLVDEFQNVRALEEVENALTAFRLEQRRRNSLRVAVAATEQTVELVDIQYRSGLTNFQNVLEAQRSLFVRQDQLAASDGQVTRNLIALYKALGGGWDPATPDVTDESPGDGGH